jgi:hypothetical protein
MVRRTSMNLYNCICILIFMASCSFVLISTPFGLYLFCGGMNCGCISLNIFSASFSLFSLTLRRCNLRFLERVSANGHHRGMKYFGSDILLVAPKSLSSFVWPIYQKNHRLFTIAMYDDICCDYFNDISICSSFDIGIYNCGQFLPMPPVGLVGLCG